MPKALFFNVPGQGHVTPSLPLVTELVRQGQEITYVVTEGYRARVEATGAHFHPYQTIHDDYFTARGLSGGVPYRVAAALIATSEAILPELLALVQTHQPDYILFDGMCPWGRLVAQIGKRPAVASLALAPLTSPPPRAMVKLLPLLLPWLLRDLPTGLTAARRAKRLTARYHLPPIGLTGILNNVGDLSLSYTSSAFQPYADTADKSVRFVGWTVPEIDADASFVLPPAEKRLIYMSLGTVNNAERAVFQACIDAFAGSDDFVIISTGKGVSPAAFGNLPSNVAIYDWVPQIAVLQRAALFISHGGLNSIHDSLYLGVPLLLVPQQVEQTINALRVVELGAGIMLKKRAIQAQTIRVQASRLLADARYQEAAKRIGDSFRQAGGVKRAADAIAMLLHHRV